MQKEREGGGGGGGKGRRHWCWMLQPGQVDVFRKMAELFLGLCCSYRQKLQPELLQSISFPFLLSTMLLQFPPISSNFFNFSNFSPHSSSMMIQESL